MLIHRTSEPVRTLHEDPLAAVVALLRPALSLAKLVEAGGRWKVERRDMASPFYCAIVEGSARLTPTGRGPITLRAGDFILIPDLQGFGMTGEAPPGPNAPSRPLEIGPGRVRLGPADAPVQMRALVGHCRFETPAKGLLVSLLPDVIHVSGNDRLTALVPVIHEETAAERPGRELILQRLLDVLLVEALRSGPAVDMPPGLLRGLSDPRLATALGRIHAQADGEVSIATLAKDAGMSRSSFFETFRREIGCAPKEYVAHWRMAVAKTLLREGRLTNAEIARRVGYGSASAFGTAFVRHEGLSPGAFAAEVGGRGGRDVSMDVIGAG